MEVFIECGFHVYGFLQVRKLGPREVKSLDHKSSPPILSLSLPLSPKSSLNFEPPVDLGVYVNKKIYAQTFLFLQIIFK